MLTDSFPSGAPGSSVSKGHVVIANHSSYIDLLYLAYQYVEISTWTKALPDFRQLLQQQ